MPNVYLKDFELNKPQKLRSLFQVEELNKARSNVDNLKYLFGVTTIMSGCRKTFIKKKYYWRKRLFALSLTDLSSQHSWSQQKS